MSHLVQIEVELKNQRSVVKACQRLEWDCQVNSSTIYYDGSKVSGSVISVPGWKFPAVVQEDGRIAADTFGTSWGNPKDLDRLKKYYAVEETKSTLAAQGIYSREYLDEKDQSITLVAEVHN
jgi:hypothetical protein